MQDKVAIITGGDSGIGRAVAIGFAKEGADVVIPYLYEHEDAKTTMEMVSRYGRRCLPIMGDLRDETFSYEVVRMTLESFGKIDVLVLNQGVQFPQESILNISTEQLKDTFRTNIFPHFFMTKAALPYLRPGSSIISTASVTAYAGAPVYPYLGYETKEVTEPVSFPLQHQTRSPGLEYLMTPRPIFDYAGYVGSGKLKGKAAIITGGDSGFGRAIAAAYAKEGADLVIVYLNEHQDAMETKQYVEQFGIRCLLLPRDLRVPETSADIIAETLRFFNRLDILINNAAVQPITESIMDVSNEQLENTFRTNVFPLFYLTKAALPYLKQGSAIINTTSRVAYEGDKNVIDYAATKGAIVSFTRTMALSLADLGIRVNAVAPGPAWTPLTVSTYSGEHVATLGNDIPFRRAAQPFEVAPAYVYLASNDSMFVTGQVIHVNGGKIRYS